MKRFYVVPFLLLSFTLLSFIKNNTEDTDPFVVVLDAGHGGHDPGNLGNGYLEKNIALNIVLKVGDILSKEKDIKVIYTRKDDTFIDLYVRGEIANKANADLFVSVHCDSHSSDAKGAGTFVLGLHANKQNFEIAKKENSVIYLEDNYQDRYAEYDINSPESVIGLTIMQEEFLDQSILLAKMMQDNFSKKLKRTDRKVKQAGFIVLHQTFMPSVLVETGFLTNKGEGKYLNSAKGQSEIGNAIAQAILSYKEGVQSAVAFTDIKATPEISDDAMAENNITIEKADETLPQNDRITEARIPEPIEIDTIKKEEVEKEKIGTAPPERPIKEEVGNHAEIAATTVENVVKETVAPPEKESDADKGIIFKVQILASSKDIALDENAFKGLNTLSKEPFKNLYRYMYGNTDSYFQAKLLKSNADAKGYTTSYVVAYKDGNRIPLKEALKSVAE